MAKLNELFAFSGTIGDLVGCKGRFGFYVRSRPRKSSKPPSVNQLAAREKMKQVMHFLEPLRPTIHRGFALPRGQDSKVAAMNRAVSYVYHHALEGEYPNFVINPATVRIAQGSLAGLEITGMEIVDNELRLYWEPRINRKDAFGDDVVYLVAYNTTEHVAPIGMASREAGIASLDVADERAGSQLLVYVCVGERDNRRFSNSQFLGTLIR
ncbi:hypothetical protein GCM10011386_14410 [Parapedobacter defluvii]|uniref:Uncharacterized protein n=1 Tax=Parapedobacter defluvii TaxID=2045106 RepID=A0ABQ1LH02_9SPHI|nr:DUF6266 family protein [Parapedobacter defluvii]GGC23591.1 hypothetical protein GCM10011386_14410 [Parapedobacter defluvii]